jgi:hypothetical protein
MRKAGFVMLFLGIVGVAVFGIQTLSHAENFSFLGIMIGHDVTGDMPLIISALLLIAGMLMARFGKPVKG